MFLGLCLKAFFEHVDFGWIFFKGRTLHRPWADLAAAPAVCERCRPDKVLSLTLVVYRQAAPSVPGGESPLVLHRQLLVERKVGAFTDPLVCAALWVYLCARA